MVNGETKMAGVGPDGELIYYPGEKDSKLKRFLYGSPLFGGGFLSYIGPIMIIWGIAFFAWAVLTSVEQEAETNSPTVQVEKIQ